MWDGCRVLVGAVEEVIAVFGVEFDLRADLPAASIFSPVAPPIARLHLSLEASSKVVGIQIQVSYSLKDDSPFTRRNPA